MQYLYSLLTVTQRFDNTKRVERFDGQTDRGEHFEICQVAHENMVLRLSYPEGEEIQVADYWSLETYLL